MASNVNIKFVIILACSLLALAGIVAGAAYMTLTNSAEDHVRMGDQHVAAGDFKEASLSYSKAVSHVPTNIEWLNKWRGALLNTIPETDLEYMQAYGEHYLGILDRLAALQPMDPAAQRELLEARYEQSLMNSGSSQTWVNFINSCESSYDKLDMSTPEAKSLLRYRGFATVKSMAVVTTSSSDHDRAIADLETAIEADPADIDAYLQLSQLRRLDWLQARNVGRPTQIASAFEKLEGSIESMREPFGDDPRFIAKELDHQVEIALRADSSVLGQKRIRAGLKGLEEPLLEAFQECDPALLSSELLVNTFSPGRSIWNIRRDDFNELGMEITERVLEVRPDDFSLRFFRGAQLMVAGRFEESDQMYQTIIEMPDIPISLDGVLLKNMRMSSLYQQANGALTKLNTLVGEQDKADTLDRIQALYTKLQEEFGPSHAMPLLIGGKLAMAERRYSDAVSLLQELDTKMTGSNVEVIRLLAQSLAEQGTHGAALVQYERWIDLDDMNAQPLMEASQIDLRLQDTDKAIERLKEALLILPDNEFIKTQLNTMMIATQEGDGDVVASDPVVAAMMRAESLAGMAGNDMSAALEILHEINEANPDDARPLTMLVEFTARSGDVDGALRYAERGLELLPGNDVFNRYIAMLRTGDRTQAAIDFIDRGDDTEPVKLVKKYALYVQVDEQDNADAMLADAVSRFPTHPAVLDAQFVRAIQSDDMPAARQVAAKAAEVNADQCDGLLYQARVNIREDALPAALSNLERAVEKAPFSPQAWRLYGQVLLRSGRIEDAVESLAKAYQYKPDDTEIAKTYASTLIQLERFDAALIVVRSARRFIKNDTPLNEMWLALESEVGDASVSIEHRMAIHESNPDDAANTQALITTLTAAGRFDEAGELIEQSINEGESDLGLTVTQARWFAEQGDLDQGIQRIETYIAGVEPSDLNERPYMALGNFLINNGRSEEGIAALRRGAEHQSMERMAASRRLGDHFFRTGNFEEALEAYQTVIDSGADATGIVAKRSIETLQRLKRWDDAEVALNKVAAGKENDMQTLLLRADIAVGREDMRTAHDLVNRAVEAAPNKPEPFIRRAQLDFTDDERLSFVLSDLQQAIRLQPTSVQPRIMRANLLTRHGRSSEAISELRRGIDSVPETNELRRLLIQELWASGHQGEAHTEAKKAIAANEGNPVWLMVAGDLASQDDNLRNNWTVAREYFVRAYEIDRSKILALRVANAYLYEDKPNPESALSALMAQGEIVDTDSQLLILRARCVNELNDHEGSIEFAERSIAAAQNVNELRHWFQHMESLFEDQRDMIAFVDRMRSSDELMPAYIVHASAFRAFDGARRGQIIQDLRASEDAVRKFAVGDGNAATLVSLYRVLGQLEYGMEQYAEAARSFTEGVKIVPTDMEFNNNLAYTLAKHLNDLEGALPPAEMAVKLAPANSPALDTLGWIYYRLGRLSQAKTKISRAMENAVTPVERGGANLHMAQILLAEGDRPQARKYADIAKKIIDTNPALGVEFSKEFIELMKELEEAESTR